MNLSVKFLIAEPWYRRLEQSAAEHNRSLAEEVRSRLLRTFTEEDRAFVVDRCYRFPVKDEV